MLTVTYLGKDQYWLFEATVYWFQIEGVDYKTSIVFEKDVYGIREEGCTSEVVDREGSPVDYNPILPDAVTRVCEVKDEYRNN